MSAQWSQRWRTRYRLEVGELGTLIMDYDTDRCGWITYMAHEDGVANRFEMLMHAPPPAGINAGVEPYQARAVEAFKAWVADQLATIEPVKVGEEDRSWQGLGDK